MKKIYVTLGILITVSFAFSQIPNPSFEQWTFSVPNGWSYVNSPYQFITQSSNVHQGNFSVKSEVILTGPICNTVSLFTGTLFNQFIPITVKPLELHGWYIFQPLSNDTFNISVTFKNNGQIIGTGSFTDGAASLSYNEFIVNINYTLSLQPDSFSIMTRFSGLYTCGSYYIVDDLSFQNFVGINEINDDGLILFPNSFTDKITITTKTNETVEVTLYDITSRKIFNQSFINSTSINTEQLAKGIYIYEVRNKNGVIKKGKVVKD